MGAAAKEEFYITNDDGSIQFTNANIRICQTFTPGTVGTGAHSLGSVIFKMFANGVDPGEYEASIQGVDGNRKPDGNSLGTATGDCSGIANGQTDWITATFTTAIPVANGTEYAIVLRQSSGTANQLGVRQDGGASAYGGGQWNYSNDAGATWS